MENADGVQGKTYQAIGMKGAVKVRYRLLLIILLLNSSLYAQVKVFKHNQPLQKVGNVYEVAKTDNVQILIDGRIEDIESVLLKCESEYMVSNQAQVQQQQDSHSFVESIIDIFKSKGSKIKQVKVKESLQANSNGTSIAVSIPMYKPRDKSDFEVIVTFRTKADGILKKKIFTLNFLING